MQDFSDIAADTGCSVAPTHQVVSRVDPLRRSRENTMRKMILMAIADYVWKRDEEKRARQHQHPLPHIREAVLDGR